MRQAISSLSSNLILKVSKFIVCMLSILVLVGCSNTENKLAEEKSKPTKVVKSKAPLKVSDDEIMKTIKDIATEKRVLGTDGEKKTAKYLKDKMGSYGYNVKYQDFEVFKIGSEERHLIHDPNIDVFLNINPLNSTESRVIARNVIAKPKNFDKNKKTLYLVAHYETTTVTTGIYDNSTGVSAVVELARVLHNYDNKNFNIAFSLFSAEEYFKMGSRYYISQLSDSERKNILGAINIDMIGYTGFNYKDFPEIGNPEILLTPLVKKDALETLFNDKFNNKYSIDNEMGGMYDDISFSRLGVPTLYFADKNFATGFEIQKKSFNTQLEPVKVSTISSLCEDIFEFIKNFDIDKFNKLDSVSDKEKGSFEEYTKNFDDKYLMISN